MLSAARRRLGRAAAPMSVGWIGLGQIGCPMAQRVSARVFGDRGNTFGDLLVYDRSEAARERFREFLRTREAAQSETSADQSVSGGSGVEVASCSTASRDAIPSVRVVDSLAEVQRASILFCSLPNSVVVREVAEAIEGLADEGDSEGGSSQKKVLVDCSSGSPEATQEIYETVLRPKNVGMVDCAVSGGPGGAVRGELTAFYGVSGRGGIFGSEVADAADAAVGDSEGGPSESSRSQTGSSSETGAEVAPTLDAEVLAAVEEVIACFAQTNRFSLGKLGSAHAVKAINNVLNAGNFVMACEGLLALRKVGVTLSTLSGLVGAFTSVKRTTLGLVDCW